MPKKTELLVVDQDLLVSGSSAGGVVGDNDPAVERAAQILRRGGLVAFPTETVYGLGAVASLPQAVRAVFTAKGRPATDPLIVHGTSIEQLDAVVDGWGTAALALAERFWPGPLTLVVPPRRRRRRGGGSGWTHGRGEGARPPGGTRAAASHRCSGGSSVGQPLRQDKPHIGRTRGRGAGRADRRGARRWSDDAGYRIDGHRPVRRRAKGPAARWSDDRGPDRGAGQSRLHRQVKRQRSALRGFIARPVHQALPRPRHRSCWSKAPSSGAGDWSPTSSTWR
ncbi:MAG: Sua5/YciO/YrdC/YwlC family protein [Microthrixaceae bacterium]